MTGEVPSTGTFGILEVSSESVVNSDSTVFNTSVFTFTSVVSVVTFSTRITAVGTESVTGGTFFRTGRTVVDF